MTDTTRIIDIPVSAMSFEREYSDESGVEYAVRLKSRAAGYVVEFEHVGTVEFPTEELVWLINVLQKISREMDIAYD